MAEVTATVVPWHRLQPIPWCPSSWQPLEAFRRLNNSTVTVEVETFTRNFYRERAALVIWAESFPGPAGSDAVPPSSLSFAYYSRDLGHRGFPRGSMVKNPPAMQEMQVWSLGQKDSLEKEMAIHSSILAWEIPWTGNTGRLQSTGSRKSQTRLWDLTTPLGHRDQELEDHESRF